jgi:phage tail protein X
MFLETSRYYQQPLVEGLARDGRRVQALSLRRLPPLSGEAVVVKGGDRLDILCQRQYSDSTRFWHIADANTELEANTPVAQPARTIIVPPT